MFRSYILEADRETVSCGTVDVVAQRWQADGRWLIGERDSRGNISFRAQSHPTLAALCASRGLTADQVRRQTRDINARRATAGRPGTSGAQPAGAAVAG